MHEKFGIPDDYYDNVHDEEATDALDSRDSEETDPDQTSNIEVCYPITQPESKKLLDFSLRLCEQITISFKTDFWNGIAEYQSDTENKKRPISPAILDSIRKNDYDIPRFTIANSHTIKEKLTGTKHLDSVSDRISSKCDPESVILVLNLPKPISFFWWKGGKKEFSDNKSQDVDPGVVNWGFLYRYVMPAIWEHLGYESCEAEEDVNIRRVNGLKEHDPLSYYYIFEISPRNK